MAAYPAESASTRYRILQFLPLLLNYSIKADTCYFLTDKEYEVMCNKHKHVKKLFILCKALLRISLGFFNVNRYHAVFISREIINFGHPIFEFILSRLYKIPIIYDLDDALWVRYKSPIIGYLTHLIKPTSKVSHIVKMSAHTIVCNNLLADYVTMYSQNVTLIPTVVDLEKYTEAKRKTASVRNDATLVIGWIGSHSTSQYLNVLLDVIYQLGKSNNFIFKVVGANTHISIPGVEVQNVPWNKDREIEEISSFSIGVYPVINNEWALGKCAFKAIQYQAAGAACVASPVGMISEVITHGYNGLLALNEDDWYLNLKTLLNDHKLRNYICMNGYANVKSRYSHTIYAPILAKIIEDTVKSSRKRFIWSE